jgi:2'-5' RNA ligase
MRLFTAVDIPADIRSHLSELLDQLRPLAELQWSKPEKLHITTAFIGEWPEARLQELEEVLGNVKSDPIPIVIRGVSWLNPHALCAGVEGPGLGNLADATWNALSSLGLTKEDRAFHPHLTLARNKKKRSNLRLDQFASSDFGTFTASNFVLFLSHGGKYAQLKRYAL